MSSSDAAALELRTSTQGGKGKREERGGEGRGKGKEGEGEEGIHGPGPARPARLPTGTQSDVSPPTSRAVLESWPKQQKVS